MKIPDIFNQSWGRLIFGSGCHVWYAMRVCLCFNPDLNDSLFDELIKRPNIRHFWESEAHVSPVSIFTVASLRLRHKLSVSWHQAALCRSRQLSEPGETQSVSARSARCITASHVSRDPSRVTKFWVLTCDCCEVWLKLSQVVINLSLWVLTRGIHQ